MKLFKSRREKILEKMQLPKEIRKLDNKEQNKMIVDFISKIFESKILEIKNILKMFQIMNIVKDKKEY